MFLSAYLALMCSQFPVNERAGENQLTTFQLKPNASGLSFDWRDTDEVLRGTITPLPRVGKSFTVSATLEPINGAPYDGPLTISVRPLEEMGATQTQTVARQKGEHAWVASFTASETVEQRIEVSWRTTHHKTVRGVFAVSEAGLPAWVGWAFGGGLVAIALAIGLWVLFGRGKESSPS